MFIFIFFFRFYKFDFVRWKLDQYNSNIDEWREICSDRNWSEQKWDTFTYPDIEVKAWQRLYNQFIYIYFHEIKLNGILLSRDMSTPLRFDMV